MSTAPQRYVSDELSHFVGREFPEDNVKQYKRLATILDGDKLKLKNHNYNSNVISRLTIDPRKPISSDEMYIPEIVCFCDIPLADLTLHTKKYGKAGLSFTKDFIIGKGGSPIQYIPRDTKVQDMKDMISKESHEDKDDEKRITTYIREAPTTNKADLFDQMVKEYHDIFFNHLYNTEIHDRAKNLYYFLNSQLFSYLKFYDHTHPDAHEDNYYMEREWRVIGSIDFEISDVQTIFLPREYAQQFRKDFPDYCSQLILL